MPETVPRRWLAPVTTHEQRELAHEWLFRRLRQENEPFLSRWLERPAATMLTRLLWRFPAHPALLTAFSIALGLAGARLLIEPSRWMWIAGAALFWAHSIADRWRDQMAQLKHYYRRLVDVMRKLNIKSKYFVNVSQSPAYVCGEL